MGWLKPVEMLPRNTTHRIVWIIGCGLRNLKKSWKTPGCCQSNESKNTSHNSFLLPAIRHFIHLIQKSSPHTRAKRLLLIRHLQLCCISRNERDHVVVFALLMRCQVIYLWITCLEQPPCAVCIFSYPLWSHVAQWLLMQLFVIQSLPSPPVSLRGGLYLSWHVPGCVGGGTDSLSRCEHPLPYCYMPNKSSPAHKLVQGKNHDGNIANTSQ